MPSKGYTSSSRFATEVSAYYPIFASDFGLIAPGAVSTTYDGGWTSSNLAYNAGAGSLAMSTAHAKITYVTAQGESAASTDVTVSIAAGTGAFTITFPAIPSATVGSPALLAAPVVGFRVYSFSSTSTALNTGTDFDATTQTLLKTVATTAGNITNVIPVGTATAQVKVYGTGAASSNINASGIQSPMPILPANGSAEVFWVVGHTFSQFKQTSFERPAAQSDPGGVVVSSMDVVGPLWQASFAAKHYQDAANVGNGSFLAIGGTLFACTTTGTTGSTIPAGLVASAPKGTVVSDNSAAWTSLGKAQVVRVRVSNTTSTSTLVPVTQEYDLFNG